MMATIREARQDMGLLVRDVLHADGRIPRERVQIGKQKFTPPKNAAWARIAIQHNSGGQSGFRGGQERYEYDGILTVQIFTPEFAADMSSDLGALNDALCQLVKEAMEGTRTEEAGVILQNVTMREVGSSGGFDQQNVVAEFKYDHVH